MGPEKKNGIARGVFSRNFHATVNLAFPERRRRRRQQVGPPIDSNSGTGDGSFYQEHFPVTDTAEFSQAAIDVLERLELAVEPMKSVNHPFIVKRKTTNLLTIELDPTNGSYEVEIDADEQILTFRSPISGSHSYFFSKKTFEWIDTTDHHSFEGLFVRDLIRVCKGVPKL